MPLPLAQQRLHQARVNSGQFRRLFLERKTAGGMSLVPIHAPLPIRLWHLASFDAPTVAVVWCLGFAWATNVRLPSWVLALIALAVWSAYVADRLLDARGGIRTLALIQLRDRHIFHWRNRSIFIPLAVSSTLAAICIICEWMPRSIRQHDSLLAVASLAYFARVHSKRAQFALFSKEFLVGVLFTLGCVLPAWSRAQFSNVSPLWPFLLASAIFASLAWLNCTAIDRWESSNEAVLGGSIFSIAGWLACASCVCAALLVRDQGPFAALVGCAAMSALLIAVLDRYRHRLTPITLRSAADLVLLAPALPLLLAPLLHR